MDNIKCVWDLPHSCPCPLLEAIGSCDRGYRAYHSQLTSWSPVMHTQLDDQPQSRLSHKTIFQKDSQEAADSYPQFQWNVSSLGLSDEADWSEEIMHFKMSAKLTNCSTYDTFYRYSAHKIETKKMLSLTTLVTSSGSWTSHPKRVSAVTGLGRAPFTSSFSRSFSVRSLDNCFRSVSNSAFFLHLVLRARTLFLSLKRH